MKHIFITLTIIVLITGNALAQGQKKFSKTKLMQDSLTYYIGIHDFKKASLWSDRAIISAESEFGKNDAEFLNVENYIYSEFFKSGYYQKALDYCLKSKETIQKVYGFDSQDYIDVISNLAVINNKLGYIGTAGDLYKKTLELSRKTLNSNSPDLASAITNLAAFYNENGNYPEADTLFKEALNIFILAFKNDHTQIAFILENIGLVNQSLCRYEIAENYFLLALNMKKRLLENTNQEFIKTYVYLAKLYLETNDLIKAEYYYKLSNEQALSLKDDTLGLAESYLNLSEFYSNLGKYSVADSLELKSMDLLIIYNKINNSLSGNIFNKLGKSFLNNFNYELAEKSLRDAYQISQGNKNNDTLTYFENMLDISKTYIYKENYNYAEKLLNEALKIFNLQNYHDSTKLTEIYYLKSIASEFKNELPDAIKNQLIAYNIAEKIYYESNFYYINNLIRLIYLYDKNNDINKSDNLILKLYNITTNLISNVLPYLNNNFRDDYQNNIIFNLEFISSYIAKHHLEEQSYLKILYNCSFLEKELEYISFNRTFKIITKNDSNLRTKANSIISSKENYAKIIQSPTNSGPFKYNFNTLSKNINEQEADLIKISPVFKDYHEKLKMNSDDIQSRLKLDDAAIEIIKIRNFANFYNDDSIQYSALILTKRLPPPGPKSSGDIRYIKFIPGFAKEIDRVIHSKYINFLSILPDKGTSYKILWQPIAKELRNPKKVYFSATGVCSYLNLYSIFDTVSNKYLIDELQICNVNSSIDIVKIKENENHFDSSKYASFYSNPILEPYNINSMIFKPSNFSYESDINKKIIFNNYDEISDYRNILNKSSNKISINLEDLEDSYKLKDWATKQQINETNIIDSLKTIPSPAILYIENPVMTISDNSQRSNIKISQILQKLPELNKESNCPLIMFSNEFLNPSKINTFNLANTEITFINPISMSPNYNYPISKLCSAFLHAGSKIVITKSNFIDEKLAYAFVSLFSEKLLSGKNRNDAYFEAIQDFRTKYPSSIEWDTFIKYGE